MSRNESEVVEEVELIIIEESDELDNKGFRYILYLIILFIIKYLIIYLIYSL